MNLCPRLQFNLLEYLLLMLPKIVSSFVACSEQNLHNKEEEDLTENTGVVPTKYPLKVKLENFHNSRVPKL